MTLAELQRELDTRDDGVLKRGAHKPGGREFCALEFEGQVRGRPWSDTPITLPDLRPLNDACWSSNEARTHALLPVMVALWDWADWSIETQQAWAARVVVLTVNRIVANLPYLPSEARARCHRATTVAEAGSAADAASRAASVAAEVASWSVEAAYAAAAAAAYAAAAAEYAVSTARAAESAVPAAAAAVANAASAVSAARAAAYAANAASAASAGAAEAEKVLHTACAIWREAATGDGA